MPPRILKELQDIAKDAANSGISAAPVGNDLTHLVAEFSGPPGTPYEGGTFKVDVRIPPQYPFKAPEMKFITKVWHPNISSQTNVICLDTLGSAWSPVLTIKSTLLSLQSLLESPEPKDPQDAEVAKMLLNDPEAFNRKARQWAIMYANAPQNGSFQSVRPRSGINPQALANDESRYQGYNKAVVNPFLDMGFDIDRIVEALQYVGIGTDAVRLGPDIVADITSHILGDM
ncbi:putative ubiquitin carrier protein [Xylariaceae sp. FL0594]|nr:putative ubiquitin carrier protein [Xylariaceae sp. FL0594]